ncbi:hypothetical protein HDU96_006227 [Phlyctochytrium bullatum]|nr:hypothetical protein HDU96_006227 [Phlyctochytrium bullatum]
MNPVELLATKSNLVGNQDSAERRDTLCKESPVISAALDHLSQDKVSSKTAGVNSRLAPSAPILSHGKAALAIGTALFSKPGVDRLPEIANPVDYVDEAENMGHLAASDLGGNDEDVNFKPHKERKQESTREKDVLIEDYRKMKIEVNTPAQSTALNEIFTSGEAENGIDLAESEDLAHIILDAIAAKNARSRHLTSLSTSRDFSKILNSPKVQPDALRSPNTLPTVTAPIFEDAGTSGLKENKHSNDKCSSYPSLQYISADSKDSAEYIEILHELDSLSAMLDKLAPDALSSIVNQLQGIEEDITTFLGTHSRSANTYTPQNLDASKSWNDSANLAFHQAKPRKPEAVLAPQQAYENPLDLLCHAAMAASKPELVLPPQQAYENPLDLLCNAAMAASKPEAVLRPQQAYENPLDLLCHAAMAASNRLADPAVPNAIAELPSSTVFSRASSELKAESESSSTGQPQIDSANVALKLQPPQQGIENPLDLLSIAAMAATSGVNDAQVQNPITGLAPVSTASEQRPGLDLLTREVMASIAASDTEMQQTGSAIVAARLQPPEQVIENPLDLLSIAAMAANSGIDNSQVPNAIADLAPQSTASEQWPGLDMFTLQIMADIAASSTEPQQINTVVNMCSLLPSHAESESLPPGFDDVTLQIMNQLNLENAATNVMQAFPNIDEQNSSPDFAQMRRAEPRTRGGKGPLQVAGVTKSVPISPISGDKPPISKAIGTSETYSAGGNDANISTPVSQTSPLAEISAKQGERTTLADMGLPSPTSLNNKPAASSFNGAVANVPLTKAELDTREIPVQGAGSTSVDEIALTLAGMSLSMSEQRTSMDLSTRATITASDGLLGQRGPRECVSMEISSPPRFPAILSQSQPVPELTMGEAMASGSSITTGRTQIDSGNVSSDDLLGQRAPKECVEMNISSPSHSPAMLSQSQPVPELPMGEAMAIESSTTTKLTTALPPTEMALSPQQGHETPLDLLSPAMVNNNGLPTVPSLDPFTWELRAESDSSSTGLPQINSANVGAELQPSGQGYGNPLDLLSIAAMAVDNEFAVPHVPNAIVDPTLLPKAPEQFPGLDMLTLQIMADIAASSTEPQQINTVDNTSSLLPSHAGSEQVQFLAPGFDELTLQIMNQLNLENAATNVMQVSPTDNERNTTTNLVERPRAEPRKRRGKGALQVGALQVADVTKSVPIGRVSGDTPNTLGASESFSGAQIPPLPESATKSSKNDPLDQLVWAIMQDIGGTDANSLTAVSQSSLLSEISAKQGDVELPTPAPLDSEQAASSSSVPLTDVEVDTSRIRVEGTGPTPEEEIALVLADMAELPQQNSEYREQSYWESRYENLDGKDPFDWCQTYDLVKDLLEKHIPDKSSRILMLGCGNAKRSRLGFTEDLCIKGGYPNITNIDYSSNVIRHMSLRTTHLPTLTWHVMDVRSLTFPDASFDVVLDKATLDALLCEKGDVWNPSPAIVADAEKAVEEAWRVLKNGGKLVYITFGQPHFRRSYFERLEWAGKEVVTLGEAFHYFFYVYTK